MKKLILLLSFIFVTVAHAQQPKIVIRLSNGSLIEHNITDIGSLEFSHNATFTVMEISFRDSLSNAAISAYSLGDVDSMVIEGISGDTALAVYHDDARSYFKLSSIDSIIFAIPSGLMAGAFDTLKNSIAPTFTSFPMKDGSTATDSIIPGEVIVLFDSTISADSAQQLLISKKGIIAAQIPAIGYYVITLDSSRLSSFLTSIFSIPQIIDAYPDGVLAQRAWKSEILTNKSICPLGDLKSLIQDIEWPGGRTDCGLDHQQKVRAFAQQGEVPENLKNIGMPTMGPDMWSSFDHNLDFGLTQAIEYSHFHNQPVIFNLSIGPIDDVAIYKKWWRERIEHLKQILRHDPHELDNIVILMAGPDKELDQTKSVTDLHNEFSNSSVWKSLYFVEASDYSNCGIGHARLGTPNVLAAAGCDLQIPGTTCSTPVSGTSFATPAIANLIGQAYLQSDKSINLQRIASIIYDYQSTHLDDKGNHDGALPSVGEIIAIGENCTYTLSSTGESVGSDASSGSLTVTPNFPYCVWTALPTAPWITVSSIAGSTINFSVAANTNSIQRTGSIAIGDQIFTVTQAGKASPSTFDGSYTGTYSGTEHWTDGTVVPVSPTTLTFTVTNGIITNLSFGAGTGSVDPSGDGKFSGGDASYSYSGDGTFQLTAGTVYANGKWSDNTPGVATGSGSWYATRP